MSNSLNSGSNATAGGGGGGGSGGGGSGSAGSGTFIDKIDPFKNQGRTNSERLAAEFSFYHI